MADKVEEENRRSLKHYLPKLSEPIGRKLLRAVWAEFLFTLLFVFATVGGVAFGCNATDVSTKTTDAQGTVAPQDCFLIQSRVLAIATSFGLAIFIFVYAAASFSGGHLNPAVSLAFFLVRRITVVRLLLYVAAQVLGAIAAAGIVLRINPQGFRAAKGGANRLIPSVSQAGGWGLEAILTAILVLVALAATDKTRAQSTAHLPVLAPIAIGFAVFLAHLAAIPIDGCSINPARSFGPAVVSGYWEHHWIFWFGPFAGAALGALIYKSFDLAEPDTGPASAAKRKAQPPLEAPVVKFPAFTGAQGLQPVYEVDDTERTVPAGEDPAVLRGDRLV